MRIVLDQRDRKVLTRLFWVCTLILSVLIYLALAKYPIDIYLDAEIKEMCHAQGYRKADTSTSNRDDSKAIEVLQTNKDTSE